MASDKVKVKFCRDHKVNAENGKHYKEGQTVEMSVASARHFCNKGAAEIIVDVKREAKPKAAKVEKTTEG